MIQISALMIYLTLSLILIVTLSGFFLMKKPVSIPERQSIQAILSSEKFKNDVTIQEHISEIKLDITLSSMENFLELLQRFEKISYGIRSIEINTKKSKATVYLDK